MLSEQWLGQSTFSIWAISIIYLLNKFLERMELEIAHG